MLIPRFSIRWLLGLTTFSAVVSLVLAQAVRGRPWALGVMAGVWCLVIVAALFVGSFLAAWLIAQARGVFIAPLESGGRGGENPFTPMPAAVAQPTLDEPPVMTG
jgi:hypothetical protein